MNLTTVQDKYIDSGPVYTATDFLFVRVNELLIYHWMIWFLLRKAKIKAPSSVSKKQNEVVIDRRVRKRSESFLVFIFFPLPPN